MSLRPAQQINFDGGGGLSADDDYVLDAQGVGHFQKVKAGSTFQFILKFTGANTNALTFEMDIREAANSADTILSTSSSGSAQITVTPNPTGTDVEQVRFSVTAAGTALLQNDSGTGRNFVYDIHVVEGTTRDKWVTGIGMTVGAITR